MKQGEKISKSREIGTIELYNIEKKLSIRTKTKHFNAPAMTVLAITGALLLLGSIDLADFLCNLPDAFFSGKIIL